MWPFAPPTTRPDSTQSTVPTTCVRQWLRQRKNWPMKQTFEDAAQVVKKMKTEKVMILGVVVDARVCQ